MSLIGQKYLWMSGLVVMSITLYNDINQFSGFIGKLVLNN